MPAEVCIINTLLATFVHKQRQLFCMQSAVGNSRALPDGLGYQVSVSTAQSIGSQGLEAGHESNLKLQETDNLEGTEDTIASYLWPVTFF